MLEKINNNWKERLKDLKCVNGAMYFGSYENPCDCGDVGCVNQATFEDNIKELENFIEQLISERDKEWEKKYTEVKIRVKENNLEGWQFFPVFVQAEDKEFFERKFDRAIKAEVDYQVAERLKTLIK